MKVDKDLMALLRATKKASEPPAAVIARIYENGRKHSSQASSDKDQLVGPIESRAAEGGPRDGRDNPLYQLIVAEIPHLRRYARTIGRRSDLADDFVQECLLRAVARIDSWTPGSNMRAWLFTILRNVIITHYRVAKHRPQTVELQPYYEQLSVSGGQDRNLDMIELQHAFDLLCDEHKEVLMLVIIEGLKYGDAASILNVPVGTVRSRLFRARSTLQEILSDDPRVAAALGREPRVRAGRSPRSPGAFSHYV